MNETRMRAIMREEIALAVKTLAEQTYCSDPGSDNYSFSEAASAFGIYAYRGACEAADAEREQEAANPFTDAGTTDPFKEDETLAANPAVKTYVQSEVLTVLRDLRSAFYMSGLDADYRIAERLDGVISERERAAEQ